MVQERSPTNYALTQRTASRSTVLASNATRSARLVFFSSATMVKGRIGLIAFVASLARSLALVLAVEYATNAAQLKTITSSQQFGTRRGLSAARVRLRDIA